MGAIYKNGYCRRCNTNTKLRKVRANHILHLLLSIITFGVWLMVWFVIGSGQSWRCDVCGTKASLSNQLSINYIIAALLLTIFISLLFLGRTSKQQIIENTQQAASYDKVDISEEDDDSDNLEGFEYLFPD